MIISAHYRVSFLDTEQRVYGVVESGTSRATRHAELKQLVVEDAIYPRIWIVEERLVRDIPISSNEYLDYIDGEFLRAQQASDQITGCQKGKLMRFPADRPGQHAYYIITEVTKTLVHLEWRGFSLDRCTEPVLGYFGKMDKKRAELLVRYDEGFERKSVSSSE